MPAADTATTACSCTSPRGDVEVTGKVGELAAAGHPVFTIDADGPADLGRIFFLSEFATAVAGWALGINPFDQPNVQEAKDNTKRVLDEGSPELEDGDARRAAGRARAAALSGDHGLRAVLERGRGAAPRAGASASIREHHVATTFGYGPRFLHSTGQFHKGGPRGRRVPADRGRAAGGPRGPRRALHLRHADPRAGRRRPADTSLARPRRRAGRKGDPLMQLGFVGLGKMGGNMVHRIHRDSDDQVVAFDFNEDAVSTAEGHGATGARSLEDLVVQARDAADRVDHGPGRRPDRADRQRSSPSCSTRATRSSTAATRNWHDDVRRASELDAIGHPLHRRRHLRRRLGPRGRLLHDGRRPRGVRRSGSRRSSTCSPRPTAGGASATPAPATS